ncbi:MAG: DUF1328 domain-containing protein [Cyclobacteriaceae bacterium]
MISWIITSLVLAVIFALLGFTGIARGFAAIAKILFYIVLVVLLVAIVASVL